MYQSNRSLNIPPWYTPDIWRLLLPRLSLPGAGHLITTHRKGRIWSLASISCYVTLIPHGVINHCRDALMHSKRKIPDSWRTGWKPKACTGFALYLKVFKNHLYYLRHIRELSIKPYLHTQLSEQSRSYWKVSRGWGHLITWNGPIMGHLNSFLASRGGNLNKNFPKIQMPGGLPRGDI